MARTRLLLFALVWLSCVWFGSWALNPNNATRMYTGMALVERGDARIDRYQALTIDKAEFGGSMIVAPDAAVLAQAGDGPDVILADLDLNAIGRGLAALDTDGHYARPDIFDLRVDRRAQVGVSDAV